ncbi:hypothetical protein GGX14DRAFT_557297 [Mycena pura]|uniref:Uncharacterized protein n=1 Tax=Mycena pura TaxID=153505 RepID=A0AAD6YNC4_9AGAR|nr:hypothetical protein GGX14DRAFT_557297 [Mycena pura]
MSWMPEDMVEALIERNVTAEHCKIREILECAVNYEWQRSIAKRYATQRRSWRSGQGDGPTCRDARDAQPRMAAAHREMAERRFRFVKRAPVKNEYKAQDKRPDAARVIPKESRPGGRDGGASGQQKSRARVVQCYNCGGPHYQDQCPKPRKPKLQMFAMRTIDDTESGAPSTKEKPGASSSAATPPDEQFNHARDESDKESGSGDGGSEYDSDYTIEECTEYSYGDEDEEHLGYIAEAGDSIPDLMDCASEMADEDTDVNGADADLGRLKCDEFTPEVRTRKPVPNNIGLFGVCDDYEDEFVSEKDIDELAQEIVVCMGATGSIEMALEYCAAVREKPPPTTSGRSKRNVYLRRSKTPQARPKCSLRENYCLTAYVKINGSTAFALFDSGCTTEACSPDFARVAGITVFPIEADVTLQLGMAGSRAKINHGMRAVIKYDDIKSDEYFDIVNLDRFNVIIGTKFMRKHRVSLDFGDNTIRVCGAPTATLTEKEEGCELERRNAARRLPKQE